MVTETAVAAAFAAWLQPCRVGLPCPSAAAFIFAVVITVLAIRSAIHH